MVCYLNIYQGRIKLKEFINMQLGFNNNVKFNDQTILKQRFIILLVTKYIGSTGRIALKYNVWLVDHYLCVLYALRVERVARAHPSYISR